jgi:hypothetical protein
MFSESVKGKAFLALALVLLLMLAPQSAYGTPSEDLHFELDLVFPLGNFTGAGNWQSSGVLQASGYAGQDDRHAGYDESGWFIRNIHATATLCTGTESQCEGVEDTITIRSHITNLDFIPFGPASGDGRWVITSATGAYAGLHGNGTATFSGNFHWSCPAPTVVGPCLTEKLTFGGQGHFDPAVRG